ncbi:MAG: dTDP-4-dehydrorhamnose 3,5-epimerase [Myxococcota bacterium]
MAFRFVPQAISDVLLIEHDRYADDRGFFTETGRDDAFAAAGLPHFVQDNHSRSQRGVLRGLHFQDAPRPLAKVVRCLRGAIFDVAVDIRRGSPTYGRWLGRELDETQPTMLFLPPGFAHGFCVLSDEADVVYRQSDYYVPELDRCLRWDDAEIGIAWPIAAPLLSPKDAAAPPLATVRNALTYPR